MTILYPAPAPVKSARPFGQGIPETESQVAIRAAFNHLFPVTTRRGRLDDPEPARVAGKVEPSAEDRAWWAAESARLESARLDRHYDDLAGESAALDRHEAGLC